MWYSIFMFNRKRLDALDAKNEELEEEVENLRIHLNESDSRREELSMTVSDYEQVFRDCFESNHRLKKLEQYLGIEYSVENPRLFIGYKKKPKQKK